MPALHAMNAPRLAWVPTSHGHVEVSVWLMCTCSGNTPSASAMVSVSDECNPCPISTPP